MRYFILLGFMFSYSYSYAQKQAVQISGVALTADSASNPIPNAKLQVKGRKLIAESGADGFFSITAIPGDSIFITRFGFKRTRLSIPDSLKGDSYIAVISMELSTTELNEVTLYPWPRPENLNRELLSMRIETNDRDIALRNLAIQSLKEQAKAMGMDAGEMQGYIMKSQAQNIHDANRYYGTGGAGTAILGRLSNPFAWSQFFNALKRGDFKN
ncbi:MAG: Uncharacterised protein [Owenweeksia sp. TMED14]|nr:MAG: Uncharacterised protein [Owenweeksia sp. TMED14]